MDQKTKKVVSKLKPNNFVLNSSATIMASQSKT